LNSGRLFLHLLAFHVYVRLASGFACASSCHRTQANLKLAQVGESYHACNDPEKAVPEVMTFVLRAPASRKAAKQS